MRCFVFRLRPLIEVYLVLYCLVRLCDTDLGVEHGGAEYNKNAKRLVLHQPFIFHFI